MNPLDTVTKALVVVGGINWGLVSVNKFDLVAKLTGNRFGETNAASRAVYGLVGGSALYQATRLAKAAA